MPESTFFSKSSEWICSVNIESYDPQDIENLVQIAFNLRGRASQMWPWLLTFHFDNQALYNQFYEIVKMLKQVERE